MHLLMYMQPSIREGKMRARKPFSHQKISRGILAASSAAGVTLLVGCQSATLRDVGDIPEPEVRICVCSEQDLPVTLHGEVASVDNKSASFTLKTEDGDVVVHAERFLSREADMREWEKANEGLKPRDRVEVGCFYREGNYEAYNLIVVSES